MKDLQYYKHRYDKAKGVSMLWMNLLRVTYKNFIPDRDLFYYPNQVQGLQKNANIFDTTPIKACRTFVSKVHMALTPPKQAWAELEAGSEVDDKDIETINEELTVYTKKLFDYLRASNFDLVIHECYRDLAVGTCALQIVEGDEETPLIFRSVPINQLYIEDSICGLVDSCYREFGETRVADILTEFPNAQLPSEILKQFSTDPNATVKNLYQAMCYVIEDKKKPYHYVLWIDGHIIESKRLESSEWVIARWSKINNQAFGIGVAIEALPAAISLQEIARIELESANFNLSKPYMGISDGIFNPWTYKIKANQIIPIARSMDGQPPLIPLPDTANPAFMQLTSETLRNQINDMMYAQPLGSVEGPARTATDSAIRQRNLLEEIGPVMTRLENELLAPIIDRVMYILAARGDLNRLVVDGKEIQVRFKSPLVTAQGQESVRKVLDGIQVLQAIYGPESSQMFLNPGELPIWVWEQFGNDPKLMPKKEELISMLKSQSEQQQEMQMAQQEQMGAQLAPQ